MSDGSTLGTTAGRAVRSILGDGKEPPLDDRDSPEAALARISELPRPSAGRPPWENDGLDDDMQYSLATDCIAKVMYDATTQDDSDLDCNAAWERAKSRWPNLDEWIGGASGFMIGFAWNLVRYIRHWDEQNNPAIVDADE